MGSHKLTQLIPGLKQIFESVGWKWELDIEGMKDHKEFSTFLEDIEEVDPLSFSFRYPTNKEGQAALPKGFHFNIIEFANKLDQILDLLDGAIEGLREIWQAAAESAFNAQHENY